MSGDSEPCELHGHRLHQLEKGEAKHEKRIDRCEAKVEVLIDNTDRLVESQKDLGKKLDEWTSSTQHRITALEVRQDNVEKRMDNRGAVATTNGLKAPTEGPAYYLAVALKYGGIPIGIAVGILIVVGGAIWILNNLGLV